MHLYAKAAVVFGVQVPDSCRGLLEETAILHEFNRVNHADLGTLLIGSFDNEELYLTAFCELAEPLEPNEFNPLSIRREYTRVWRRELEKFLREQNIEPVGEIRFRILAGLDN